jgi:hypothetical protein
MVLPIQADKLASLGLLSAGVAYASYRMGVPSTLAPWVGLGAFLVYAGVIVYFMEFRRP